MLAGIVSVALLLPAGLAHRLTEHCAPAAAVEAPHHPGDHGPVPNNSPDHRSDPCPQGPPTQCGSGSSYASLIQSLLAQFGWLPPLLAAALPDQLAARLPLGLSEPPTPPPQGPFRFV